MSDINKVNTQEETRTPDNAERAKKYGFKIGRVVSHLDPGYMGTLKVTLLNFDSAGNEAEEKGETIDVEYAPVFYGTTPPEHLGLNGTYEDTQQSYGWWAVPPDVGTRVLCGFVDGDINKGYWFACIQDRYMNFMVPGAQPATEYYKGQVPQGVTGRKLPTAEYNKRIDGTDQKDPSKNKKPLNLKFIEKLKESGLADDDIRGVTSTSARRELPSAVYGLSSPGPLDKNGPKAPRGVKDEKADVYKSRLGGQSFVIDDGDDKRLRKGPAKDTPYEYIDQEASSGGDKTIPHNEMVRFKTRTGHQILLHNSEDLIYISNGRGTTWIELTSNGKIDIYAQDSISVHSENDINFVADRDINLEAGRFMNFAANDSIFQKVGKNIEQRIGQDLRVSAAKDIQMYAVKDNYITAGEKNYFNSYLETYMTSLKDMHIHTKQDEANLHIVVGKDFNLKVAKKSKITSEESHINSPKGHYETAKPIHMNGPTAEQAPASAEQALFVEEVALAAKFPKRVPQHEPWPEHENWNPNLVVPEKTEATPDTNDVHIPEGERVAVDRALISGLKDSGKGEDLPEIPVRPE